MREVILDTNILLDGVDLSQFYKVYLPITVLEELDSIKHKSEGELNYKARKAIKQIEEVNNVEYKLDYSFSLPIWLDRDVPDNRIIGFAKDIITINPDVVLISNDVNVRVKAKALGIPCEKFDGNSNEIEIYKGYKEVTLSEYEMSLHYQCPINKYGLLHNEYLLIRDGNGEIVDRQRWTDEKGFIPLSTRTLKSVYFGDLKARDAWQMMAIDSLNSTNITLLFGVSGSAKTLLSLAWIMQNIQSGKIGKAVIIFNSVPLKNNKQQGFYPGDRNQKLLQSSLGGILSSKFGDMTMVETLITQGKLLLIPSAEIRGVEVADNDCIFVTESQNTDIYTMKTIIQRAKGKVIIEGDLLEQQDLLNNNPKDNGMMRTIEIFKGSQYFSCVKLKNRYRHPMGDLADKM